MMKKEAGILASILGKSPSIDDEQFALEFDFIDDSSNSAQDNKRMSDDGSLEENMKSEQKDVNQLESRIVQPELFFEGTSGGGSEGSSAGVTSPADGNECDLLALMDS